MGQHQRGRHLAGMGQGTHQHGGAAALHAREEQAQSAAAAAAAAAAGSLFSSSDVGRAPLATGAASSEVIGLAGNSDSGMGSSSFLDQLRPNPGGRYIELVMLNVALCACLVMWCFARDASGLDEIGGESPPVRKEAEAVYRRLRNRYLSVYTLAVFGDWIQGGFAYALYAAYGYSQREISLIFIVGYASSMTIGTYVSALGDTGGHRRNCVAYGILYAASCVLCHSRSLASLLLGRMLGGVAYSILYTSFESWLIAEAEARRLPRVLLSRLFSFSTFCNAGSAVVAGMVGHLVIEVLPCASRNRFACAFDVAVVSLLGASLVAATRWGERYGDQLHSTSESLLKSYRTIRGSRPLVALGLVNSFYEAALYVFVFLWTPALERRSRQGDGTSNMGHGLVFSVFMISKMAGSQASHVLSEYLSPGARLQLVFCGSALCLAAPLLTDSYEYTLLAFCGFEALLGIYWPTIALLRCGSILDAQRASTMAVFRVLLNLLVILVLPLAGGLPEALAFSLAAGMLLLCLALSGILRQAETSAHGKEGHVLVRLMTSDGLYLPLLVSTDLCSPPSSGTSR